MSQYDFGLVLAFAAFTVLWAIDPNPWGIFFIVGTGWVIVDEFGKELE